MVLKYVLENIENKVSFNTIFSSNVQLLGITFYTGEIHFKSFFRDFKAIRSYFKTVQFELEHVKFGIEFAKKENEEITFLTLYKF